MFISFSDVVRAVGRAPLVLFDRFADQCDAAAERRAAQALDDRLLRDMGADRGDIDRLIRSGRDS